ncbi:MAG: SCO family protein [Cyclobacteriaceae bacterium]|nr:SCO family protein [Cyclobacteriaceae bacterium]
MRTLFGLIFITILIAGCTKEPETLPFFNTPDFTPQWISTETPEYAAIHSLPTFSFVDQDGDTITDKNIEGKIVVADFFFTICPGICPRLTKSMENVQSSFKDDDMITLLSHSVTPDLDSVPRLKEYANSHNVQKGKWHLLTGDRKQIYTIARQGYFADEEVGLKKSENEFLHTENFILLDGQKRIRGVYNGTNPTEIERLIEDIHILKKEMQHANS